jgi:transcriptional/translational regulatory protein YebC/TACO1
VVEVSRTTVGEDELMEAALEAGADDVSTEGENYEVLTPPAAFEAVKTALAARGWSLPHAEMTRIAGTLVPVTGKTATAVLRLIENLEDHDDVQKVYANFSMDDEVLAGHSD